MTRVQRAIYIHIQRKTILEIYRINRRVKLGIGREQDEKHGDNDNR